MIKSRTGTVVPGRHWAAIGGKGKEPGRPPRPRLRVTPQSRLYIMRSRVITALRDALAGNPWMPPLPDHA